MTSSDITFLYTNIPIIDMSSIIKEYVKNNDQYTGETAKPQGKFLDLVILVLASTWYNFNSKF